jgi:tRNA threonylcarbamoyladenosine biosynthesis protein TsaE
MTILNSVESTKAFGEELGRKCQGGEIFALYGELGAGKTQFVKGLARGLNFSGEVTSPTFTLVHEYLGGRIPIYHFDLYRIADSKEAQRFGIEEYLSGEGVCVIEWPEKIKEMLPESAQHWRIKILTLVERQIERQDVKSSY